MIKNIVFDLGGVLVDFHPEVLLKHLGFNESEVEYFKKIIFWGKEWNLFNQSKFDHETLREEIIKNNSEHADKITYIFDNLDYKYILFEKTDTAEYVKELKEQGYNIYILSDLSKFSYEYNSSMSFYKYVSGGTYSFEVGSTKPSDNNYIRLIEDHNIVPDETIFIDDRLENAYKAEEFGIHGVQFTTLEEVKEKVNDLIKEGNSRIQV